MVTVLPPVYDRRQPSKGSYSAIVYQEGDQVIAEDSNGSKIYKNTHIATNDTACIQAAIDHFPNGQAVIYIAEGNYNINASLNIKTAVGGTPQNMFTIKGAGPRGCFDDQSFNRPATALFQKFSGSMIKCLGSLTDPDVNGTGHFQQLYIQDLGFIQDVADWGDGSAPTYVGKALEMAGICGLYIENCSFQNITGGAISCIEVWNGCVRYCHFGLCGSAASSIPTCYFGGDPTPARQPAASTGIYSCSMAITYESNINSVDEYCAIKTGTTATITGFLESSYIAHNWMEGSNETFGASIYNCPSFAFISGQIQSTEIHDNYLIFGGIVAGHGLGDGIQLIDGGLSPIHDNYIEQTYNGINISGSSYSEVHHNIIRAYANNGIVVSGWLASVQGNSISYGATTGLAGIYGLYANDAQITGNTIIEAWNKGIVLDSASRCIVQSNKITNDTNNHCTVGIVETGDSDYNNISGNMIDSTVTTSITRIGTHGKVIGNSGYNPVYAPSGPSVPATTVAFANTFGYACLVRVTGGASVTDVYVNGILMFHQTGAAIERNFIVPAGGTITLTYTSTAPTWTWTGIN